MSSNALYGARPTVVGTDYLSQQHFMLTVMAAAALHVAAFGVWRMMPHTEVIDVPVRVLNVKLGEEDAPAVEAIKPDVFNSADIENAISRAVRENKEASNVIGSMEMAMNNLSKQAASKALDQAILTTGGVAAGAVRDSARKLSDVARQFVRENTAPPVATTGVAIGNSDKKSAEMISRYEQLISLWIQKFKLYPEEARKQGMQGDTVVRIRIDRQGNIRYYILENSTGSQVLDRSVIDMVRRANPVPAVPTNYPPGDLIEFLIPVSFHLQ